MSGKKLLIIVLIGLFLLLCCGLAAAAFYIAENPSRVEVDVDDDATNDVDEDTSNDVEEDTSDEVDDDSASGIEPACPNTADWFNANKPIASNTLFVYFKSTTSLTSAKAVLMAYGINTTAVDFSDYGVGGNYKVTVSVETGKEEDTACGIEAASSIFVDKVEGQKAL